MKFPGGILFDLDGVIYVGNRLIPGALETIKKLRANGIPYRFVTNTTRMTKIQLVTFLGKVGFNVSSENVFSAPHAAVEYCKLKKFKTISLIVPDPEMKKDFSFFKLVDDNPDAIVLGDMGQFFTFDLLNKLFNDVINGSQIVAMHKNRYWKSARGLTMDLGGFIAALEYATGKPAVVIGKPSQNIFNMAVRSWNIPKNLIFMVGDDIEGDIGGAKNAKMKSILVKTVKFQEDGLACAKIKPDYIINSVADLPRLFKLS